jgi:hypothetical protein
MEERFKNVICEPKDIVTDIKRQVLELISLNQTICNNLPNLKIPNIQKLDPSQEVIDFLVDILGIVTGINYDEMRLQLINWLVEQLQPLSEDLSFNLMKSIKNCYACKINPEIPGWLFVTQPSTYTYDSNGVPIPNTGTPGIGFNVELNKIDFTCLFATNPDSEVGKLLYDGNSTNDINSFLWGVIQENGNPLLWSDPITNIPIAEFRYFENNPSAFIESDSQVEYQNIEPRPRVFNIRIVNDYYEKSLITFLNDYFNSQNPLFNPNTVIPNVINLIYGTLSKKINLSENCLTNIVETEESLNDYIINGIDNPEIIFDDSFYQFTPKQLKNIKNKVKNKKSGVKEFEKCCGKKISTISFETLNEIDIEINNSVTFQERIETYTNAITKLSEESMVGVTDLDKNNASSEFFSNFIRSLQIVLSKLVLSPKNLTIINLFYFLVNKKSISSINKKGILKEFECILKPIITAIIKKIIYEFLLPLVLKSLTNLITCTITKKLKEKDLYYLKSMTSLLPPVISNSIEDINELFGKTKDTVEKLRGFSDSINLNSLNNVNLQFGKKGRFCD